MNEQDEIVTNAQCNDMPELWTESGQRDYLAYLMTHQGMSEQDAKAHLASVTGSAS